MNVTEWLTLAALILAIGGTLIRFGQVKGDLSRRIAAIEKRLDDHDGEDIDSRLTALETKIEPLWAAVGKTAAAMLHSPHTPDFDELLEKYQANRLSWNERDRLIEILQGLSQVGTTSEAALARILLRAMREGTRVWPLAEDPARPPEVES